MAPEALKLIVHNKKEDAFSTIHGNYASIPLHDQEELWLCAQ